jgi:hypothetical protein
MLASSCLTTVNKTLYEKFNFSSPLNLFLVQCFCNVSICMSLMAYKTYVDSEAFESLKSVGIKISTLPECFSKFRNGFIIGGLNIVTVLFGLYSVKYVNIPLFLTFRRCAILATIIVTYVISGKGPNNTLAGCAFVMVTGALLAGYESFDDNAFGYLLIWGNNFAQSIYNVVASIFNEDKKITSFEINFYFALIGLPLMGYLTVSSGEIVKLQDALFGGQDSTQTFLIFFSGISGILITMSSILTVTLCGPIA